MQQVKNIVKGPYEPQDNTVMWIDTSNPDAPIAKVHSNGEWQAISGVDNLPTVLNEIVDDFGPVELVVDDDSDSYVEGTQEEVLSLFSIDGKPVTYNELVGLLNRNILLIYRGNQVRISSSWEAGGHMILVFGAINTKNQGVEATISLFGENSFFDLYEI